MANKQPVKILVDLENRLPVLKDASEQTITSFITEFQTYRRVGGTQTLNKLIEANVFEIIALQCNKSVDDLTDMREEDLLAVLKNVYSPKHLLQVLDSLNSISYGSTNLISKSLAVQFCIAFNQKFKLLTDKNLIPSNIRDIFLSTVPERLRQYVRAQTSPNIEFKELARIFLSAAEEFDKARLLQPAPRVLQDQQPQGNFRSENRVQQHSFRNNDFRSVCYRCNQPGHLAYQCPNKPDSQQRNTASYRNSINSRSDFRSNNRDPLPRILDNKARRTDVAESDLSESQDIRNTIQPEDAAVIAEEMCELRRCAFENAPMIAPDPHIEADVAIRTVVSVAVSKVEMATHEISVPGMEEKVIVIPKPARDAPKEAFLHGTLVCPTGTFDCTVLADTGATQPILTSAAAQRTIGLGARARDVSLQVKGVGTKRVTKLLELPFRTRGASNRLVQLTIEALVLDLDDADGKYDLILGYQELHCLGLITLKGFDAAGKAIEEFSKPLGPDLVDVVEDIEPKTTVTATEIDPRAEAMFAPLLQKYAEVFDQNLPASGANFKPMTISLQNGCVPRSAVPRRYPQKHIDIISAEVNKLLEQGRIEKCNSPIVSNVVVVDEGSKYRVCGDFREVNLCTLPSRWPLPNIREILASLKGSKYYAKYDLCTSFLQCPLEEASQDLTAIITPLGVYRYKFVPYGIRNASGYFQEQMKIAFLDLDWLRIFVDDVLIYADSLEQLYERVEIFLRRAHEYLIRFKLPKCVFGARKIALLGYVVDSAGIWISDERKLAVKDMRLPETQTELRSFLCTLQFFHSFVGNHSELAADLHALTSAKVKYVLTDEIQQKLETLRTACLNAVKLYHLREELTIYLRTDASMKGIGALLFQRVGSEIFPVHMVSRAFKGSELSWSTPEQECFAIYYAINHLSYYLLGNNFICECDHRNLVFLSKSTAPKLVRWRLALQQYSFEIHHISGRLNEIADAFSRLLVAQTLDEHDIARYHNSTVGHKGIRATLKLLSEAGIKWEGMERDITAFIQSCALCQKVWSGKASMAAALKTISITQPFHTIAVDTMGPFPRDIFNFTHLAVFIDIFTRWIELFPMADTSAKAVAPGLLAVVGRFGCPYYIRSDNGSQFSNNLIKELVELMGGKQYFTIAYRSESNGTAERANREVLRQLQIICADRRIASRWSQCLPLIQRCLNASFHKSIGTTPARMLFGDQILLNRNLLLPSNLPDGKVSTVEDYINQLNIMQAVILQNAQTVQQAVIDKRLSKSPENPISFVEGDRVLVTYPNRSPSKLTPKNRGPLVVVQCEGNVYSVQDLLHNTIERVDVSRLIPFIEADGVDIEQVAAIDKDTYLIDSIVSHKGPKNGPKSKLFFKVHWLGYETKDDTWEPYKNIAKTEALQKYALEHPELRI